MQRFIVSSTAAIAASASGCPRSLIAATATSPDMSSMICSPTSGVCHCTARSCQVKASVTAPLAIVNERSSSGCVSAIRSVSSEPQSWPTRSTGSPISSIWRTIQAAYSSFVAPNPSGTGQPKPGSASATASSRVSSASTGSHNAAVSGTPWTKTAGTAAAYVDPGRARRAAERCRRLRGCRRARRDVLGPAVVGLAARRALTIRSTRCSSRGHLVAGDRSYGSAPGATSSVECRAVTRLDDRGDALAPALVGHADDDAVVHVGVATSPPPRPPRGRSSRRPS